MRRRINRYINGKLESIVTEEFENGDTRRDPYTHTLEFYHAKNKEWSVHKPN